MNKSSGFIMKIEPTKLSLYKPTSPERFASSTLAQGIKLNWNFNLLWKESKMTKEMKKIKKQIDKENKTRLTTE